MKMKQKIYRQFCLIAGLTILISVLVISAIFYRWFKTQIFDDLRNYAHVMSSVDEATRTQIIENVHELDELRVTIIQPDGKVLMDTDADVTGMDNHRNRAEIKGALAFGEGSDMRRSRTIAKTTYYYAIRMPDGTVLRVAMEAKSIYHVLQGMLPMIFGVAAILFVLCMILGHWLTDSLLRPIEQLADHMDNMGEIAVYEEMEPFIQTIRRQHEDILKNASMRQDFTANVSHELKTPLAAISGYSELIENEMVSEKDVARFGGEIHKSADRLLTLINDTIRLSELDAGPVEQVLETVDLYQVAKNCVETLQIPAQKHEVTLSLSGESCEITTEKGMAEEVIYNLCDNAIRYNNKGGHVDVTVRKENGHTVLIVKDTGIGIPKEHQDRIFERFYRVDKSRSKSTGGTGLGLAIVKHIVARSHAEMTLTSEVGKGTEIKIVYK